MELTALCFRLLILVLILLGAHVQSNTAAIRIIPHRLQVFEFQSVVFHCDGLDSSDQLKEIRNIKSFISHCENRGTPTMFCIIQRAYPTDSGEYWCETEGRERSNSVNISVTVGSVILESPAIPVTEGESVTLRCKNKTISSHFTADFYKNGLFMGNSSTGEITFNSVSTADEGLYKCSIPDAGESPESWLTVRVLNRETCPSPDHSYNVYLVLRAVFTIVMVALLLVVVGLLHCGKLRVTQK